MGISSDVNNWYLDRFAEGDARFVWSQVYETLVRLDSDMNITLRLAESWETPDEGKTWVLPAGLQTELRSCTPEKSLKSERQPM